MNASDSTHGSSSQAVSSGFQTLDQEVSPGLKHDLKKHQNCEVDRLLSALLQRCRNTAPPGPTPSTPSAGSAVAAPPASPPSPNGTERATMRPSVPSTAISPPDPGSGTTSSAKSDGNGNEDEGEDEDLLQHCLKAVLPICNSTDMRELLNV
jgi:hypothetical protein